MKELISQVPVHTFVYLPAIGKDVKSILFAHNGNDLFSLKVGMGGGEWPGRYLRRRESRWMEEEAVVEKFANALNYSLSGRLISIEAGGQAGSFSMRFPLSSSAGWRRSIKTLSVCK